MDKYVIDTQALVKFFNGIKVINEHITNILQLADEGKAVIIIPTPVIFEIAYLNEKGRIPITIEHIRDILDNCLNYMEEKLSIEVIKSAFEITDIPELHDRLIAGTARYLNLPLITNDPIILKSKYVECVT